MPDTAPPAALPAADATAASATTTAPPAPLVRVRVWDLPTRLFHWSLVFCVAGLVATAYGGTEMLEWHVRLAHAVLALVIFRVVWGVVGGRWSRFWHFVYSPVTVLRYVRGRPTDVAHVDVGHSPLGALSVFALLGVVGLQLWTGLVIDDEIAFQGPLNRYAGSTFVAWASSWHRGWGPWWLLGTVVLHVAAIQFYLLRRKDLLTPMIDGDKLLPAGTPGSRDTARTRVAAMWLMILCGWIALGVYRML